MAENPVNTQWFILCRRSSLCLFMRGVRRRVQPSPSHRRCWVLNRPPRKENRVESSSGKPRLQDHFSHVCSFSSLIASQSYGTTNNYLSSGVDIFCSCLVLHGDARSAPNGALWLCTSSVCAPWHWSDCPALGRRPHYTVSCPQ